MNFIDFIIIAGLAYAAWKGFKKGLVIELFTFLALFFGLYAGIHFSDFLSEIIRERLGLTSEYLPAISFTLIFLAIGAMIYFGGKAIEKVVKIVQLSLVNKLLGVFFGILKMTFFFGAGILLLESYNQKGKLMSEKTQNGSLFYNPTKIIVTACIPAFEESTLLLKNVLLEEPSIMLNEESSEEVEI